MRILFVCGAGKMFGRECVTLSIMKGLSDRGHSIECLSSTWSDGKLERQLAKLSIPFEQLPLGFISKTLTFSAMRMTLVQALKLPALWISYRRTLKRFQPDIIVHSAIHHVALLWPLFGREKNVFHVHDSFVPSRFYTQLFAILSRRIAIFIGVSEFVANSLLLLGLPQRMVTHVLNGVSLDDPGSSQVNEDAAVDNGNATVRIGLVGQIASWKGHGVLIEALKILQERRVQFVCRFFGEGSSEFQSLLRSRIDYYNLGNKVEWQGFLSDKRSIYRNIDICVVPSTFPEPFGMVAAEAAIFGLPVVASRTGGLPEVVVNQRTGYLIEPGSAEQLAEKLQTLSLSHTQRQEMGARAARYVLDRLSTNRMIEEIATLLERLQSEKRVENRTERVAARV